MNVDSTPYFATNDKWFYYNPDWNSYYGCLLTEEGKKIPEVVRSYEDFYDINNPLLYDNDLPDNVDGLKEMAIKQDNCVKLHGIKNNHSTSGQKPDKTYHC